MAGIIDLLTAGFSRMTLLLVVVPDSMISLWIRNLET
jgi:hypothetical protein